MLPPRSLVLEATECPEHYISQNVEARADILGINQQAPIMDGSAAAADEPEQAKRHQRQQSSVTHRTRGQQR